MPARRRHYPDRAPATGISATRGAYDSCRTCGHARVKHLTGPLPGCAGLVYVTTAQGGQYHPPRMGSCPCPRFNESEE